MVYYIESLKSRIFLQKMSFLILDICEDFVLIIRLINKFEKLEKYILKLCLMFINRWFFNGILLFEMRKIVEHFIDYTYPIFIIGKQNL